MVAGRNGSGKYFRFGPDTDNFRPRNPPLSAISALEVDLSQAFFRLQNVENYSPVAKKRAVLLPPKIVLGPANVEPKALHASCLHRFREICSMRKNFAASPHKDKAARKAHAICATPTERLDERASAGRLSQRESSLEYPHAPEPPLCTPRKQIQVSCVTFSHWSCVTTQLLSN